MKTTRLIPSLLIAMLLLTPPLQAQQRRRQQGRNSNGVAMPERVVPVTPRTPQPPAQPVERDAEAKGGADAPALPAKDAAPENATPVPASDAGAAAKEPPTPIKGGVLLNFQGASLTDVLNYLSEAAGFIIVQDVPVTGTVNVVSKQPVSPDEAVDLLNTVLAEKGYTAIRSERILKIVNRKDALKKDLPVRVGSDPDKIQRKDEMVTQILPLRSGEAAKLIENLRPLLDNATMSANESSNSIIMTDTLTNIRRIAQIIQAIDTSVLGISTIHIYPLQFADSKELATVVTQLFSPTSTQGGGRGGRGGGGGGGGNPFGGFFGGPGGPGGGGGGQPAAPQSEAKQAESRVVAVADEQSNSLVVSASDSLIPMITDVVLKLDTSGAEVSETRIFRLLHADSVELATIITTLYGDTTTQRSQGGQNQFGGRGGFPFGPQPQSSSTQKSSRSLQQAKVTAVGDPRTNSLLISAARDTIMSIAELVGRLDASDSKKQKVYYHSLTHADADNVANVLRGMLGDANAINNSSQSGSNRLTTRSANGAAMDTTEFSGSNTGRGGTGR
jgi:general secretion pathway protein D